MTDEESQGLSCNDHFLLLPANSHHRTKPLKCDLSLWGCSDSKHNLRQPEAGCRLQADSRSVGKTQEGKHQCFGRARPSQKNLLIRCSTFDLQQVRCLLWSSWRGLAQGSAPSLPPCWLSASLNSLIFHIRTATRLDPFIRRHVGLLLFYF